MPYYSFSFFVNNIFEKHLFFTNYAWHSQINHESNTTMRKHLSNEIPFTTPVTPEEILALYCYTF